MNILGLSASYHDSAAALVRDGEILAAAQEERFTRVKYDHSFPTNALNYCLKEAGITPAEIDAVVFYEKPILKFERLLETYAAYAPRGLGSFIKAMPLWLHEKLFIPREIDGGLNNQYEGPIYFTKHHEAHAASAFFPSPFEEAAILTMDGVGEWVTTSWGIGRGNNIKLKQEIRFPHSIGLLYSAFTYYTGFRVNSGEYKLMGLAPYGEPKYVDLIMKNLIDLKDDGSFVLDMSYFNYCQGLTMTGPRFHKLFGGRPRKPESPLTQRDMDIAASIQQVTEEIVLRVVRHVHYETNVKNLCLAGGVTLNCVANGRILREGSFESIWIQPAAGDAGGALGAALFCWHQIKGNARKLAKKDIQKGSFLGPKYSNDEVMAYLNSADAKYSVINDESILADKIATYLEAGKVVGHVSGRMEFGPRALGGRSILGDARNLKMQSQMNLKIKFRESFRPFAPSCLAEDVSNYFELGEESPYMLLVAKVRKDRCKELSEDQKKLFGIDLLNIPRSDIPAVTHVDHSARVQTVDSECNGRFHKMLEAFKKRTGYGLLINTSFNIRGEPIVCTPEDAYRCFMFTDMDILVMENCICFKEEQPSMPGAREYRQKFKLD